MPFLEYTNQDSIILNLHLENPHIWSNHRIPLQDVKDIFEQTDIKVNDQEILEFIANLYC